ncbi:MAG: H-type small acid-soluble spore protein [Bacillota bacterium]
MDSKRAKQILESHGVIEVKYHDSPVWIEQIKDESSAEVTDLNTNRRMDVSIDQLEEADTVM